MAVKSILTVQMFAGDGAFPANGSNLSHALYSSSVLSLRWMFLDPEHSLFSCSCLLTATRTPWFCFAFQQKALLDKWVYPEILSDFSPVSDYPVCLVRFRARTVLWSCARR